MKNNLDADLRALIHDANNLLNNIVKCSERASADDLGRDQVLNHLAVIKKNAFKISSLFESFKGNTNGAKSEKISVRSILDELTEEFSATEGGRIKFEERFDKSEFKIYWNRDDCARVFSNLLTNASEAIRGEGKVWISTEFIKVKTDGGYPKKLKSGNFLQVDIRDNGCGISDEEKSKIFEDGFSSKGADGSRGTGLKSTKELLLAIGGWIDAEKSTNSGAVFSLFIPAVKDAWTGTGKPPHILLAEDDVVLNEMLCDELKSLGLEISAVSDGQNAKRIIESKQSFDLCVFDHQIPDISGLECARKLFEISPDTPVVLTTGDTEKFDKLPDNIRYVIQKPFDSERLLSAIGHLV